MATYNKEFTVKNGIVVENNNAVKLSTNVGTLRFVSLKAPSSLTGDYTLTMPVDNGAPNELLITDGNGVLSWGKVNTINMFPNSVTPTILEATGDFTMNSLIVNRVKATGDIVLDPNNDNDVTGVVEIKGDLIVRGSNNIVAGASFGIETQNFIAQVSGRYLIDTETNADDIEVTLPTNPNVGNTIEFADMKNSWDAYNVILNAGVGKSFQDKTGEVDSPYILDVAGVAVKLVWTGEYWKVFASS